MNGRANVGISSSIFEMDSCCGRDEASLTRLTRYTLHAICEKGDTERLQELLTKADADEDYDPSEGSLSQTLDLNARDNLGCTPLHTALLSRQVECARICLAHKAKINPKCNGSPPLHIALAMGSIPENHQFVKEALALLLASGADVASTDDMGRYPLHLAAAFATTTSSTTTTTTTTTSTLQGDTAMVGKNNFEIATMLKTAAGANFQVELFDRNGATPLHIAAEYMNESMFIWLLSQDGTSVGDVNSGGGGEDGGAGSSNNSSSSSRQISVPVMGTDKLGDSPAHIAAKMGWARGVSLLHEHVKSKQGPSHAAAFVKATNAVGMTAEEILFSVTGMTTTTMTTSSSTTTPTTSPTLTPTTLILTHEACTHHHTCLPIARDLAYIPPENTMRLDVLLNPLYGSLQATNLRSKSRIVYGAPPCKMSDVLRVHEYEYVRRVLSKIGEAAPKADATGGEGVKLLDSDTTVSRGSWDAALRAAGAVCAAIDSVVSGETKTAFCPVRPPGHHAGPRGIVTCERDMEGSHGFCLLNNVAVGAAYAMHHYGRAPYGYAGEAKAVAAASATSNAGNATTSASTTTSSSSSSATPTTTTRPMIRRVAIFDFDVHHGNGTEAILRNLVPNECVETVSLPFARAAISMMSYRPWLDSDDGDRVLFVSSHGYGAKRDEENKPIGTFYPGSGSSTGWDVQALEKVSVEAGTGGGTGGGGGGGGGGGNSSLMMSPRPGGLSASSSSSSVETPSASNTSSTTNTSANHLHIAVPTSSSSSTASSVSNVPYTPLSVLASPRTVAASNSARNLFDISSVATDAPAAVPSLLIPSITQQPPLPEPLLETGIAQPHVINVAMNHGYGPRMWRRIMVSDVLPRVAAFEPDLILISAGFDAHKSDTINSGYMRLTEDDYYWITRNLVKIANKTANGRVVSVLEGGYKVQGRIISPFARSVASHVRALSGGFTDTWDTQRERELLVRELQWEAEQQAAAANVAIGVAGAGFSNTTTSLKTPRSFNTNSSSGSATASTTEMLISAINSSASSSASSMQVDASSYTGGGGGGEESERKSKRKRATVDYAALEAKLAAEEAAAKEAAATATSATGAGTEGSSSAP